MLHIPLGLLLEEKKVVAYFNSGFLGDLYTDGVDYLNFAFAYVNPDGSIYLDESNREKLEKNLPVMKILKKQRPDLKTLITVGGYDNSPVFPKVANNAVKRLIFATTTKSFMEEYGFDGVDIDWEFTECSQTTNYVDLVKDMRFINPSKLLTVSVFRRPGRMACIDYTQLSPLVDHYNVLTYEYYGPWSKVTGFNTPLGHVKGEPCHLDIEDSTNVFLSMRGVPKNKVILGLAFYGQQFSGTDGLYKPFEKGQRIDFKNIPSVGTVYNAEAQSVSIYENEQLTTFDNAQSIAAKCNYVIQMDVAGAIAWELGGDKNGELLKVVVEKLKRQHRRGKYRRSAACTCMHD